MTQNHELPPSEWSIDYDSPEQHRSTHRKAPRGADDEQRLTEDTIALAKQYGRYGYRRVTALLRHAGRTVTRPDGATLRL